MRKLYEALELGKIGIFESPTGTVRIFWTLLFFADSFQIIKSIITLFRADWHMFVAYDVLMYFNAWKYLLFWQNYWLVFVYLHIKEIAELLDSETYFFTKSFVLFDWLIKNYTVNGFCVIFLKLC